MRGALRIETWRGKRIDDMTADELRPAFREICQEHFKLLQERLHEASVWRSLSLDEALRAPPAWHVDSMTGGAHYMRPAPPLRLILFCAVAVVAAALVLLDHFGAFR